MSSVLSNHNGVKLEINYNKKTEKHTNAWRLNNRLLNNKLVNNEIKEEIKRYLETSENENTAIQNVWHIAKEVLKGKLTTIQAYLKK